STCARIATGSGGTPSTISKGSGSSIIPGRWRPVPWHQTRPTAPPARRRQRRRRRGPRDQRDGAVGRQLEAEARHERTLEAGSSRPLLDHLCRPFASFCLGNGHVGWLDMRRVPADLDIGIPILRNNRSINASNELLWHTPTYASNE